MILNSNKLRLIRGFISSIDNLITRFNTIKRLNGKRILPFRGQKKGN